MNVLKYLANQSTETLPVVLATVVQTKGHSPQKSGARLILFSDNTTKGTIGGGELEFYVLTQCRQVLSHGIPQVLELSLTANAAVDVDMICGGTMTVFIEKIS